MAKKIITKTQAISCPVAFDQDWASVSPTHVQGSEKRALGNAIMVESGGRYKLFTDGEDYVKILSGSGHVKWARGEFPFSKSDILHLSAVGEYEINGKCQFIAVKL